MDDYQAIYRVSAELSRLLADETPLEQILFSIGRLGVASIPACEAAGVTLEDHGKVVARTTTTPGLEEVDSYQYELGDGPCLHTSKTGSAVLVENMATESRWPTFSAFATERGVASTYSIPMKQADAVVGVLNLYSYGDPFGPRDEQIGLLFAEEAAVAVRNVATFAKTRELIENLSRALDSRSEIGTAVGLIMYRDGVSRAAAFELLKEASQRTNTKLRDVAERMIGEFQLGTSPVDRSVREPSSLLEATQQPDRA